MSHGKNSRYAIFSPNVYNSLMELENAQHSIICYRCICKYIIYKTVKLAQTVGAPNDIMHFVKPPTTIIDAPVGQGKVVGGKVPRPF